MIIGGALGEASDGCEHFVRGLGPHKGLRRGVVRVDEGPNGVFEFHNAAKDASAYLLVRELGKPPLDEIEPRPVGRREVDVKPWPLGQPALNQRGLVRAVVVQNEMDGHGGVDRTEELARLDRAVAAMELADYRSHVIVNTFLYGLKGQ